MTTYHLNFWRKINGSVDIERLYVNADDGSTLGFIERRMIEAGRQAGSYYDAHRIAKGDTTVVVSNEIRISLPDGAARKIVEAVAAQPGYEFVLATDDVQKFIALKGFARGIKWCAPKAQVKKLKAQADAFAVKI